MSKKDKDPNVIVLVGGTRIDTRTGKRIEEAEEQQPQSSGVEPAQATTPDTMRSVSVISATKRAYELKEPTAVMNAVGAVLMYELYGLPIHEIATYLSVPVERIASITESDAYATAKADILHNIILSMEDDVRGILAANAKKAANAVVDGLNSKDTDAKLKAAASVLDRAGFSPQQVILHKHSFEDELVIRHVKTSKEDKMPLIDLEAIDA